MHGASEPRITTDASNAWAGREGDKRTANLWHLRSLRAIPFACRGESMDVAVELAGKIQLVVLGELFGAF